MPRVEMVALVGKDDTRMCSGKEMASYCTLGNLISLRYSHMDRGIQMWWIQL